MARTVNDIEMDKATRLDLAGQVNQMAIAAAQLQQVVAPIALYPDALVAQILPAATYPEQIVEAAKWMDEHKGLQGDQLAKEVDGQLWDPSVKALTLAISLPAVLGAGMVPQTSSSKVENAA